MLTTLTPRAGGRIGQEQCTGNWCRTATGAALALAGTNSSELGSSRPSTHTLRAPDPPDVSAQIRTSEIRHPKELECRGSGN